MTHDTLTRPWRPEPFMVFMIVILIVVCAFAAVLWDARGIERERLAQRDRDIADCKAVGGFPIIDRWGVRLERCER